MNAPREMDAELEALRRAWLAHPELDLGELVDSAARLMGCTDPWSVGGSLRPGLERLVDTPPIPARLPLTGDR